MGNEVNFRAVHTKRAWRKAQHSSIERALRDPKRGALALFRGTNDYINSKDYGDPLYAFVWTENEGYAARPDPSADMEVVKVPVSLLWEFDSAKEVNEEKLISYFMDPATAPGAVSSEHQADAAYGPRWWWVNHKQTFRSEFEGGYIWSPKANANGAKNVTYENLTRVVPGDVIVSYAGGLVKAIGVATAYYREATKPDSFGDAGAAWADLGWMVAVDWVPLASPISPKAHIDAIRGLLPVRHSPLQTNGNGNQGCYLASVSPELGELIIAMSDDQGAGLAAALDALSEEAKEGSVETEIVADTHLSSTERIQLVRSRRGQGLFRQRVLAAEPRCRLTGVSDQSFLIASHIKPWCACENSERLDGYNGLMLSPHIDHLFDRHLISFEDDGTLLVSEVAARVMADWGIAESYFSIPFHEQQKVYMAHHRILFERARARVREEEPKNEC